MALPGIYCSRNCIWMGGQDMLHKDRLCADAGTQNCPCRLADFGKCLVCRKLAGGDCCGCDWQGVCIYNEFLQNNCRIGCQRQEVICGIEKTTWYEEDLVVMRVSVPRGLAEKASLPGSFVFLKYPGEEQFFSVPVSVMRADHENGFLDFAIKVNGPKTENLMRCCDSKGKGLSTSGYVEMRGIYRNGLLGAEKLLTHSPKKVLCLTKGVGLAPVANYIRWSEGNDRIDLIVDIEKISRAFAESALDDCIIDSLQYMTLPLNMTWAEEEDYDVIVISASEYFQQNIYVPESKKVLSNNHSMCCGEGICGACFYTDPEGNVHRMCKCNI